MPPRLSLLRASTALHTLHPLHTPATPLAAFLVPFLHQQPAQQHRAASILSALSDNPGAYNKRIRRGRGPSSGKGKTSGRGHKGQKQHGKVPRGFNGGQTPIEVVHGKRGFENQFSVEMSSLNVDRLQSWIDQGRIDPSKPITMKELNASRCLHGVKDGVKLLARGADQMRTPVNIVVSRASAAAIAAIEAAGGTVTTRYYSPTSVRAVMRGDMHPTVSLQSATSPEQLAEALRQYPKRLPDPASRKDIEYYRDPAHRGYLSHLLQEGQGPSLFFKTPGQVKMGKKGTVVRGNKKSAKAENRLW